jgi:hypothetical protein
VELERNKYMIYMRTNTKPTPKSGFFNTFPPFSPPNRFAREHRGMQGFGGILCVRVVDLCNNRYKGVKHNDKNLRIGEGGVQVRRSQSQILAGVGGAVPLLKWFLPEESLTLCLRGWSGLLYGSISRHHLHKHGRHIH